VSDVELNMLTKKFGIEESKFLYSPLFYQQQSEQKENKSFTEKKNICSIGNFLHAPNVDSVHYMKEKIWPFILDKVSEDVELHIYGSNASKIHMDLDDPSKRFRIKGYVEDQYHTLAQYR